MLLKLIDFARWLFDRKGWRRIHPADEFHKLKPSDLPRNRKPLTWGKRNGPVD